jgi:hypothetical protein
VLLGICAPSLKLNIPLSLSSGALRVVFLVLYALFFFIPGLDFILPMGLFTWFIRWLPDLSFKFEACCAHDRLAATIQNNQHSPS